MMTMASIAPPAPPPDEILAMGPPPEDPSEIAMWQYRALNMLAWDVLRDANIDADTRRRRAPALIAAAARIMPDAIKAEVAKRIRASDAAIAQKKRAAPSAKMEPRDPPGAARVIPIRGNG